MELYGVIYPDNMAWVYVVVVDLEERALKCLLSLHDENVPELENLDPYMQALRERFEEPTTAWHRSLHRCPEAGEATGNGVHSRFLLPSQPLGRLV